MNSFQGLDVILSMNVAAALVMVFFTVMLLMLERKPYLKCWLIFWTSLTLSHLFLLMASHFNVDILQIFSTFFLVLALPFLWHGVVLKRQLSTVLHLVVPIYGFTLFFFLLLLMPFNANLKLMFIYIYSGLMLMLSGLLSIASRNLFLRIFGYSAFATGALNIYFPFVVEHQIILFATLLTMSGLFMSLSMLLIPIKSVLIKQRKTNQSLYYQTMHDALTGVKNRAYLTKKAQQLDMNGEAYALLVIDLNNLKDINDQHGHLLGDTVIKKTADVLSVTFKNADVCRFGGDEFVILMYEQFDIIEANIEHIRREHAELDLAIGYAIKQAGDLFNAVFTLAERRMYEQKATL